MIKEEIERIYNIWDTQNIIEKPVKKEMYIDSFDHIASFFALGTFFYFIYNFDTMKVEMVHEASQSVLGISPEEFSIKKFLGKVHPVDLINLSKKAQANINFLYNRIPSKDILDYKVVYNLRVKHTNGTYKTIMQQSKTIMLSDDNKIQKVFITHTDVSHLNLPIDDKVAFISSKKPSYYYLEMEDKYYKLNEKPDELFTQREKEIILFISKGFSFIKIAKELCLSPHTINTHKRNILKKTKCNNFTELVAKCIRNGII